MYTIHLAKEPFKFSCSHFTILGPQNAERLHGHNYYVRVSLSFIMLDPQLGLAFDFNQAKPHIKELCDQLDERILLPAQSPFLKLKIHAHQIEVQFSEKFYSFPEVDTLCLPLVNISSEALASYFGNQLKEAFKLLPAWTTLRVNIEETRGQSVTYRLNR